jgi:hypothetical protein
LNNSSQNKKEQKTTSLVVLASALILSSVTAVQVVTSNAYAQSSSPTVTGTCELERLPGEEAGTHLVTTFTVSGTEPSPTRYYHELLDSDGDRISSGGAISGEFCFGGGEQGGERTFNLYQDFDGDFETEGIESDELVASDTITCPSYTELFSNQGLCIRHANANPGGTITRSGCQEAF